MNWCLVKIMKLIVGTWSKRWQWRCWSKCWSGSHHALCWSRCLCVHSGSTWLNRQVVKLTLSTYKLIDYSNSPQTTLTLFNRHLNSGPGFTSQVNYLLLRSSFLILPTHLPFLFISNRPLLVWPGDLDSVIPILGSPRFCGIRRLFTNPSCVFVP